MCMRNDDTASDIVDGNSMTVTGAVAGSVTRRIVGTAFMYASRKGSEQIFEDFS